MTEPLEPGKARRLIQEILENGSVVFSGHAQKALADDQLSAPDAINVLRAGVVEPAELERDSWRYRVRTQKIVVVIMFRSASEIRVITAWRKK